MMTRVPYSARAARDNGSKLREDEERTVIECPNIQRHDIRNHYDLSTLFYRLLWGPHIHHGYWEAQESPRRAQVQLTERMARLAQIQPGSRVLDVGCGMGGSSIWLARHQQCSVTGVTISPLQKHWATTAAALHGCRQRTEFRCQDAESLDLPAASMDVIWSIECTEHLYDKPTFFKKAAQWLRPDGTLTICAWLVGQDERAPATVEQVVDVCEGMLCPSLGSQADYIAWFEQAGLSLTQAELWTPQVLRTWEICKQRVERSRVRWLARMLGKTHTLFLDRFDAILNAYRSGAMDYGFFVAKQPG